MPKFLSNFSLKLDHRDDLILQPHWLISKSNPSNSQIFWKFSLKNISMVAVSYCCHWDRLAGRFSGVPLGFFIGFHFERMRSPHHLKDWVCESLSSIWLIFVAVYSLKVDFHLQKVRVLLILQIQKHLEDLPPNFFNIPCSNLKITADSCMWKYGLMGASIVASE